MNPIGIGWAGPTLLVAGTEAQQQGVAARHPRRLRDLVPAVQRARSRERPRVAADPRGARRRGVRRERAEGVDDARARRAVRDPARAHRPRRARAGGHHLLRRRHALAGHRGAAARADDRHARVQRGVLHRRARARRERGRHRARRLAAREGHARQRARLALGRRRAVGPRPDRERRDRPRARARRHDRSPAAPAARSAVLRSGGAAPDPAAHAFGAAARARTRARRHRCARRSPTSTAST